MSDLSGKTLGRYHILRKTGRGGMAVVYRGFDLENQRKVAIKVMASYLVEDPKFRSRFEREIELLRELEHPNIVPVLDFGEHEEAPYIVMPYIESGTLQDRLKVTPLTAIEASKLSQQISSALQFAHDQGIVHRDIKPSNILLDGEGNALLSDFGFAHWHDASMSLTGSGLIGTPAYMSPEQCMGGQVDVRSDQYSLGVVLYRIATGRLPFEGDTPLALAIKQINAPLPPPREVNPNIPETVEAVLVKALAKEPEHRFQSVAHLNSAFHDALAVVIDPEGKYTPMPMHLDIDSRTLEWKEEEEDRGVLAWFRSVRRPVLVGAAVLLFAFPVGASALLGWSNIGFGDRGTPTQTPTLNFEATIQALYTENAPLAGLEESFPGQVETAVAGTMMALEAGSGEDGAEATPELDASPTQTSTGGAVAGFRSGASTPTTEAGGSSGGNPSATSSSASATPAPTSAGTSAPTDIPPTSPPPTSPPPTDPPPPPTDPPPEPTEEPVNKNCEKLPPSNPHYCGP